MPDLENRERTRSEKSNDEIDLLVVFKHFGNFFKKIGKFIATILKAIRVRILLVLILSIIGGLIGYTLYKSSKPYYTSSMTLVLSQIRNEFVEDQLLKLGAMIEDNNFEEVAKRLDVSVKSASQIKNMKIANLDQDRVADDSVLTGSPFRIELSLYDNSEFDSMEQAIANYLENNRYFSKQKLIKQKQVENMISKYRNEIRSLDSIKTTITSPRGPVGGFVYGEPIDPTNLYKEGLNMYRQQVEMEAELAQLDNIQVVNGFSPRLNPTGPSMIKYVVLSSLIFFIIATIVAYQKLEKDKL